MPCSELAEKELYTEGTGGLMHTKLIINQQFEAKKCQQLPGRMLHAG